MGPGFTVEIVWLEEGLGDSCFLQALRHHLLICPVTLPRFQASPGNLQAVEDLLFSNLDIVSSPIVLALHLKMQNGVLMVGAAYADATNRDLGVAEYADNTLFSNTEVSSKTSHTGLHGFWELKKRSKAHTIDLITLILPSAQSLLIQLGVKECVLPADDKSTDYDLSKLRLVVDRCDCVITERKKSEFSSKDIEQDISRLLSNADESKAIRGYSHSQGRSSKVRRTNLTQLFLFSLHFYLQPSSISKSL